MRTIYKFAIRIGAGEHVIHLPADAEPVLVGQQEQMAHEHVVGIWFLRDPMAPKVARSFAAYGTGQDVAAHHRPLGSVMTGPFVWHVFEATIAAQEA
jgi:hypothetical protein